MTQRNRLYFVGLCVLHVCVALLIAWLGSYSRLLADDYCIAATAQGRNAFEATVYWYQNWSGLYSNFFLKSWLAEPLITVTATMPGLLIVMWFGALLALCYQLVRWLRMRAELVVAVYLAALMTFTTLNSVNSLQNLYWFSALVPYNLPAILLVALVAYLLWRIRRYHLTVFDALFAALTGFIVVGFSETYATVLITVCVLALMLHYLRFGIFARPNMRPMLWLTLLSVTVGLLLVLIAPGNAERQVAVALDSGITHTPPTLPVLALQTVVTALLFFFADTFSLANALAVLIYVLLGTLLYYSSQDLRNLPYPRQPLLFALGSLLAVLLCIMAVMAPQYYGVGLINGRTLWFARFLQLALFAVWGYLLAVGLSRVNIRVRSKRLLQVVQLSCLLMLLFLPLQSITRHGVLLPDFARFAIAWNARHDYLASVQGAEAVTVEPLPYHIAEPIQLEKIEPQNAATFVNSCAASYYDVTAIYVAQSTPNQSYARTRTNSGFM